jgi:heptosyltransferase-2
LELCEPSIFFREEDVQMFSDLFLEISKHRPRIVLVTETSSGHPNAWYTERFTQLGKSLYKNHNALILLVGAASDASNIENIQQQIGYDAISLAGQTSPRQLAALMAICDFCISVDTGAMHVARAVTLPTVIIGNAAQPIDLWLPPSNLDYIELIRKDHLPCSVCWKLNCETKECMDEISVNDVESAFLYLKNRVPWGSVARRQRVLNFSS